MKRSILALVATGSAIAALPATWACSGEEFYYEYEDVDAGEEVDGGQRGDGGSAKCGVPSGVPPHALVLRGGFRPTDKTELAAINLETKEVSGRVSFEGNYGFTSSLGADPWFVSGVTNQVVKLDAREPWKVVATWDVLGDDPTEAEPTNANPVAVVPVSCDKAYVLRFNRNKIAVIDPSSNGGKPTKYIDLGPLVQDGDPGVLEVTSAVYVSSKKRVYVLLGNADLSRVDSTGFTILCTDLKPSIVAIDVETDELVDLGGQAPGKGIFLEGYNPPIGVPLTYDVLNDRLLVMQGGCNEDQAGEPGPAVRRRIEEVSLASGAVKTLVSLDDKGFPSSFGFADPRNAAVAFYFEGAFRWNPATPTLSPITGQVDAVASDGRGAFVGFRSIAADGGPSTHEILRIPLAGDPEVIATNPFTEPGGAIGGIEVWPHR